MAKPRILVFASGSATSGGSGFENLVIASRNGLLNADIVGVVSNHKDGGVYRRCKELGSIYFEHCEGAPTAEKYQAMAVASRANFFALSGWLKPVVGLDLSTRFNPRTVFNIHPGPLPRFGGKGMYGHHVHEAVMAAYKRGELTHSAVSMHFVTEEYDKGPKFLDHPVAINETDTAESLAAKVNLCERHLQPLLTHMVVNGYIKWDGEDPKTLQYPQMSFAE